MLKDAFDEHQQVVAASVSEVLPALEQAVAVTVARLAAGSKILALGNGGSAAQAQHFVAEIVGRFAADRRALPAVALPADAVVLSAVGNDYGFERVFARQVEALAQPGDVVVAISTSGRSANVVEAARAAARNGCQVIGLTGRGGGDLASEVDVLVAVPSDQVARIQEVHTICLHAWASEVERAVGSAAALTRP